MANPFIRRMQSVMKRSVLCSCVIIVIVVCLAFGVLGKGLPDRTCPQGEAKWYEGKDLKLVHVVS